MNMNTYVDYHDIIFKKHHKYIEYPELSDIHCSIPLDPKTMKHDGLKPPNMGYNP